MNLLYVVSLYPCWSETFIVREMKYFKEQGVNIDVLSLRGNTEEFVQENDIESVNSVVYTKGNWSQFFSLLKYFVLHPILIFTWFIKNIVSFWHSPITLLKNISTILRALSVIQEFDHIDHIHAHWATYPSTAAMLISQLTGKTFSFTSHAHDIFLENHFIKDKVNASKFSVTISNFNVSLLNKLKGIDSSKIKVVHCAIDLNEYLIENCNKEFNVLAVGRFDEIKGYKYLIDAISILRSKNISICCNIVGSGELRDELVAQTNQLDLNNNVIFHSAKPQNEIRNLMQKSDMFVLPSIKTTSGNMDGIPVVLMESMALGTPVISTYVSGIPELIKNGINGFLVEQKNAVQLADAIDLVLNMGENEKQELIKNARKTIENDFNVNIEANKLLDFIKE